MNKKSLIRSIVVAVLALFLLSACGNAAPKVGSTFHIQDGTKAYQVKQDRSGLDVCYLPEQDVEIVRNTYWETYIGSTEADYTVDLSEIKVSDKGTCDIRSIFMKDDDLK